MDKARNLESGPSSSVVWKPFAPPLIIPRGWALRSFSKGHFQLLRHPFF